MELTQQQLNASLIGNGLLQPGELLRAQSHGDGLAFHTTRPLVTGSAPTWLVAFQNAAQGDPADLI